MMRLLPARTLYIVMGLSLAGACTLLPLLNTYQDHLEQTEEGLKLDLQNRKNALIHAREDSDLTQKLNSAPDGNEIEQVLAPVDRLTVTALIERQAKISRLANLNYALTPETKITRETALAGNVELALSHITFDAEAEVDNDVYVFLEALRRSMPGKLHIQHMKLERAANQTDSALHAHVEMEWLSNGVASKVAHAP